VLGLRLVEPNPCTDQPPFLRCSSSLQILNFGSVSFQNVSVAEDIAECTSIVTGEIQCHLQVTSVIFICALLISDGKKWNVQIKNSNWKRKINIEKQFPD